ncbi:hypothetical protein NE865_07315 [Phthorimaea operculella]|nr:hypothetical protein NE865_07315 [Phthorimaea operculella]
MTLRLELVWLIQSPWHLKLFRTIRDVDYECEIDISTDNLNWMIAVIHYPNNVAMNCDANPAAFHVMRKDECLAVCDMLDYNDKFSKEWVMFTKGRFRFQFRSSSNVNTDMEANSYSVTVTTARMRPVNGSCFSKKNETECHAPPPHDKYFCITSAAICDGINNCGVSNWFDEKKNDCAVPYVQLSYVSIFAVIGLLIFSLLAGFHILLSNLPQASSFFVYVTNEDNRFCIDPTLTLPVREPLVRERKKNVEDDSSESSWDESGDEEETLITDFNGSPSTRSRVSLAHEMIRQAKEKVLSAKDKEHSISKTLPLFSRTKKEQS